MLATLAADGSPHLVPVTFAVEGQRIWTAVDHKPKRSVRLRRLANVERDARVALLVDGYDEDWTRLWWCRADGVATVLHDEAAIGKAGQLLRARYPQYDGHEISGPAVVIDVTAWTGWRAIG